MIERNERKVILVSCAYLNHLSSLELLDVTELASFADQLASLHVDSALGIKG